MTREEWAKTVDRLLARWPRWGARCSGVELEDWETAFAHLNCEWVEEAMQRARRKYSSDDPKIKWVADAFFQVENERSAQVRQEEAAQEAAEAAEDKAHEWDRWVETHREIARGLTKLTPDQRTRAARVVRRFFDGGGGDDPREWSPVFAGLVYAGAKRLGFL